MVLVVAANSFTSLISSVIRCSLDFNVIVNDLTLAAKERLVSVRRAASFYLLFDFLALKHLALE